MADGHAREDHRVGADPAITADHHIAFAGRIVLDVLDGIDHGRKRVGGQPVGTVLTAQQNLYPRRDRGVGANFQYSVVAKFDDFRNAIGAYPDTVSGIAQPDFFCSALELVHRAQSLALPTLFQEVE
ncbi:hypothetical protein D9M71_673310 [compost metagenome]